LPSTPDEASKTALKAQNLDEGFDGYLSHFHPDMPTGAVIGFAEGEYEDHEWSNFEPVPGNPKSHVDCKQEIAAVTT
jgi:hypothetical protein